MNNKWLLIFLCLLPLISQAMDAPLPAQKSAGNAFIENPQALKDVRLDLAGLKITNLNNLSDIPGIDTITELDLSNNQLTRIPNNAFSFMPNLQIINLDHNEIATIEPLAFNNLKQLQQLFLDHNKLQKISIELAHLFFLTKLGLANNMIEKIATNAFRDLWRLEIVDLSHNRLVSLPDDLFAPLQAHEIYKSNYPGMNLTFLDVSNNGIAHLPLQFFKNLKKLQFLDISNNPFKPTPGYKNAILKRMAEGALIDV